jgi:hypothetical protein
MSRRERVRLPGYPESDMRVSDVFVPGGFPDITYVRRDELQLEERVRDYLDERYKCCRFRGHDEVRTSRSCSCSDR